MAKQISNFRIYTAFASTSFLSFDQFTKKISRRMVPVASDNIEIEYPFLAHNTLFGATLANPDTTITEVQTEIKTAKISLKKTKKEAIQALEERDLLLETVSIGDNFLETLEKAQYKLTEDSMYGGDFHLVRIRPRTWALLPAETMESEIVIGDGASVWFKARSHFTCFYIEKGGGGIMVSLKEILAQASDSYKNEPKLMKELRQAHGLRNLPLSVSTYRKRDEIEDGFYLNDWYEFAKHYTGFDSKKIMSLLMSKLVVEIDSDEFEWGLSKILENLNRDEFYETINRVKQKNAIDYSLLGKCLMAKAALLNVDEVQNILKEHKPEKNFTQNTFIKGLEFLGKEKVYKILLQLNSYGDLSMVKDTWSAISQLRTGNNELSKEVLSRIESLGFSNIKTFHDKVVAEKNYYERKLETQPIEYSGFRAKLSELEVEGYEIFIPKESGDLLDIGQQLHNCIGAVYKEKVLNGTATILGLKKDGELKVAMNIGIEEPIRLRYENSDKVDFGSPGKVWIQEIREDYNKMAHDETRYAVEKQLVELFTKYKKELLDNNSNR